jgi:uncharacterized protein YndB with AHSA1/START domain/predicted enzyme related to lactoylglutathione lyase
MTTAVPSTVSHGVTVSRRINAPRERIFAAWTTPEDILKWLGPPECQALSAEVDARPGGEYRIRMQSKNMGEVTVRGVFQIVEHPSKLAYTWAWEGAEALSFGETLVTVEFEEAGGATNVKIRHRGFPAVEPAENHEYGWGGSFDKLAALVECGRPPLAMGSIVWNELVCQNPEAAGKFYQSVFGWQPVAAPMSVMPYTLFKRDGADRGGMMKCPNPEAPSHWLAYVLVENVDATCATAKSLGAVVVVDPFDIPNVGRIAVFLDTQGAAVGVMQPAR